MPLAKCSFVNHLMYTSLPSKYGSCCLRLFYCRFYAFRMHCFASYPFCYLIKSDLLAQSMEYTYLMLYYQPFSGEVMPNTAAKARIEKQEFEPITELLDDTRVYGTEDLPPVGKEDFPTRISLM